MSIGQKFELVADAVYEKGKKDENKHFWESLPVDSTNIKFYGWTDDTFYPTRDIWVGEQTFYFSKITDLEARLNEQGVKLLFRSSVCNYAFGYCQSKTIPEVDLSSVTSATLIFGQYSAASSQASQNKLESIRKVISSAKTVFANNSFSGCYKLIHCIFEGTIAKSLDIHWSKKLSRESILSLLQVLKASVTGVTITLPAKCIDTATDTKAMIEGDTELNTAYTQALANGYTIAFQ